jgi:hypothetical protein
MKRDLIERALFPLFGFRQPKHFALGIVGRTLAAKILLAANFNEPVHELHSRVKPIHSARLADSTRGVRFLFSHDNRTIFRVATQQAGGHAAAFQAKPSQRLPIFNRGGFAVYLSATLSALHSFTATDLDRSKSPEKREGGDNEPERR